MRKTKLKKDILDFLSMASMVFGLLFLSMWIVYYIVENYVDINSIFGGKIEKNVVYILEDVDNDKYIPYLRGYLKRDYHIIKVTSNVLSQKKKGLLFLINVNKLDKRVRNRIIKFVRNGGGIIFNNSDAELVKVITKLKKIDILKKGSYEAQTPLLSTFKIDKQKVDLNNDIYLYDKPALLDFTKDHTSYGVMWEGNFGNGNWLYFSFPFYIIENNDFKFVSKKLQKSEQHVTRLLKDMVDFIYYGYKVVKFPYVDTDKMVLIDEYMDYKYNDNFMKYIQQHKLKATIFINPNIVKKPIKVDNRYIEIASMSDKYKYKLQKYTTQKIVGFSNENVLNPDVTKLYKQYGFKYILSQFFSSGIYFNNFVVLAHDGFNDISLNDNIKEIEKNIEFYSKYRIYTFTIHSYILAEQNNFDILDKLLKDLKKYPIYTAKEIAERYNDTHKISMSAMLTPASLAVRIVNDTLKEMHNVTFRVYSKYKFDKIESNFFNIHAYIIKETPEYIDVRVEKMNTNVQFYLRFK